MKILDILNQLAATSKRTEKIEIITANKDNATFMRVLRYALDPYMNFYIRKIPSYNTVGGMSLHEALNQLLHLSDRTHTGHAGIAHLQHILESVDADDAVVVERIIGKDLRCGAADGTVNAVVKDFIPTYPCLLARPYDEKNIKNIVYPAYSQLKADGLRVNFIVNDGNVTVCGRSGRDIDLLGKMDELMLFLATQAGGNCVFDGELVVVDNQGKIVDRKTGNGIINKAIKGTISEKEAKQVRVQLWDLIPFNEFIGGKSSDTYQGRFLKLNQAVSRAKLMGKEQKDVNLILENRVVNSLEEAVAHFEELLALGEEGTILKNFGGIWEDTRSKDLVKMKAEKTADLEIVGWNPGNGKFEGQVGSLICASSDRLVEVAISGFSDDKRKEITEQINSLIGGIVEVMYNERIKSKEKGRENKDSLFLPRLNVFRLDKFVADSTDEIK